MPEAATLTSDTATAWQDTTLLLLTAVSDHLVHVEAAQADPFRKVLRDSTETLRNSPTASQISMTAGSVAQALTQYCKQLQESVNTLAAAARRPAVQAAAAPGQANTVDPATGLPIRSEAEAALKRAMEGARQCYVAVFYLHRMPLTNARFGQAIGDQVILFCSQHLASIVTRGNDALFRWGGPVFVAVLEREDSETAVAADVQRLLSAPLSRFFETSSRSVYLPVRVTGTVMPLFDTHYEEVQANIEQFILMSAQ